MKLARLLSVAAMATLTGCAFGPMPQNAEEFRAYVRKGSIGTVFESYEVNNSFSKTAATLKTKGDECFNRTITIRSCQGGCDTIQYILIPHFTSKGRSAELVVRMKTDHGNVKDIQLGGPPPEGGAYATVADAVDMGNGKTKISVYGPKYHMFSHIPRAIKHWTNGSNLGCPDFTADL